MKASSLLTKDLVAGLLFCVIGISFYWIGSDYRFGTSRQMGPGYFPVVLSVLLTGIGIVVAANGARSGNERLEDLNLKGLGLVAGATLAFALLVRPAGMPIAIFVLSFFGSMASSRFRLIPSLLLSFGLSVFCLVTFNFALGMPFPIWGYWFR